MRSSSQNSSNDEDGNCASQISKSKMSNKSQQQNNRQPTNPAHQTPQSLSQKLQNPRSANQYSIKASAINFKQSPISIKQNAPPVTQKKLLKSKVTDVALTIPVQGQQLNYQTNTKSNQPNFFGIPSNLSAKPTLNDDYKDEKQCLESKDPNQKDPNEKLFCIINGNGYNIIRNSLLQKPGWKEVKKDDLWTKMMGPNHSVNFIWKPSNFNYKMYSQIDQVLHKNQYFSEDQRNKELIVNHLEGHREITTKTGLIRSLKYYYKDNVNFIENNYQVFDSMPTSYVVSSKLETYEYQQFIQRFEELAHTEGKTIKEKVPDKHCKNNIWLIKPANENQGKGIKIFDELSQIIRFLESSLQFSYWVIQKYLERPLLFKGRKFDIRMWGFAHSNLDFYFYDIGYLRTSSYEYTTDTKVDGYVHLTNNCLQKLNKETYGMHEEGNTVSLEQFQQYLNENFGQHSLQVYDHFISRMKDLALDCYMSCKNVLDPSKRKNSFEFFGFDFMIDEDFRVWLIEVNTNPYIGIHNQGMKHILPEMLQSLFKIVLDPVFETNLSQNELENPSEGTHFDLLYSRTKGIYKRRPVQEGIYPIKELDPRKIYPKRQQISKKNAKKTLDEKLLQTQTQQMSSQFLQDIKLVNVQKNENKSGKKQNQNQGLINGEIKQGNYNSTQRVERVTRVSSNNFSNQNKYNQNTDNNSLNNQTIELIDQDQEQKREDFNISLTDQKVKNKANNKSNFSVSPDHLNINLKKQTQNKLINQNFQIKTSKTSISKTEQKIIDDKNKRQSQNLQKIQTNSVIDEEIEISQLSSNQTSQNENQMSRSITSGGVKLSQKEKSQSSNGYISRNLISSQNNAGTNSQFITTQAAKSETKKGKYLPVLEQQNEQSPESIQGANNFNRQRDSIHNNQKNEGSQNKNYLPKTIVQQVRTLDKKSQFCNQHIQHIFHRIKATYKSWELFSDSQIKDANLALKMMLQTASFSIDQQIPLVRIISQLIGSNEVPITLRYELGKILFQILKNKLCARTLLEENQEITQHLKNTLKVLQESCSSHQTSEHIIEYQTEMHELQILSSTILIQMMSLTNRKYYIPGETSENTKQRIKAIQIGIHMTLLFTYLNTKNERLKQFLNEDFLERLDETDIQLHFDNSDKILQDFHQIYFYIYGGNTKEININEDEINQPTSSMSLPFNMSGQSYQEQITDFLKQKVQILKQIKFKDQQVMILKKQEEEQRENQIKKQTEQELKEKRQRAEDAMKRRIKEMKERNVTDNRAIQNITNDQKQEIIKSEKTQYMFEKIDKISNKIFVQQHFQQKSQNQQNQQYQTTQTPQLSNNLIDPSSSKRQEQLFIANNNYHLENIIPQINNQVNDSDKALSVQRVKRSAAIILVGPTQANASSSTRPPNSQYQKVEEVAEQMLMKEERRRQEIVQQLRRKQEMRKKRENSEKRRKIIQDKLMEEEIEKKRQQKEFERKQALEEWLKGKKTDEKKRGQLPKFLIDKKIIQQNQQSQTIYNSNIIQRQQNQNQEFKNAAQIILSQKINELNFNEQQTIQRATSLSCKLSGNNDGFSPSQQINIRENQNLYGSQVDQNMEDFEGRHFNYSQKNVQNELNYQNQGFVSSLDFENPQLIEMNKNQKKSNSNFSTSSQGFNSSQQKYLNSIKIAQLNKIQQNIDNLTKQRRQILEGTTNPIALKFKQIEMAEQNENQKHEQIYQDVLNQKKLQSIKREKEID